VGSEARLLALVLMAGGILALFLAGWSLVHKDVYYSEVIVVEPGEKAVFYATRGAEIVIDGYIAPLCEQGRVRITMEGYGTVWEAGGGDTRSFEIPNPCEYEQCTFYVEAYAEPGCDQKARLDIYVYTINTAKVVYYTLFGLVLLGAGLAIVKMS